MQEVKRWGPGDLLLAVTVSLPVWLVTTVVSLVVGLVMGGVAGVATWLFTAREVRQVWRGLADTTLETITYNDEEVQALRRDLFGK